MARPFSMIVDINDKKQTWKLAVRITRLWYVEIPKKPMAIEMLLTDAKGDRIHAVVKGNDAIAWKPILKEDSCYTMQNFDVKPNVGQYKTSVHPFKLLFMSGTTVKENDLPEVPHDVFHFTPFDEILSGKACTDVLVDVIGVFDKMGRYHSDAKLKKVEFSLKGQSGTTLNCTLWEGYASKLVSFIDNHNGGPIVIILTFAKIKEPQGIFPLSIQNSKFCSRLLINADVPEIQKYKESLDPSQAYESGTIIMSQVSGSSQLSSQDNFFYKADVKILSEICSLMKECQWVTVATIDMILTRHGWNYDGCTSCSRREDSCKCVNPKIVPRFKVEIKVCYKGEYANFIMWNNECFELLNETALELKNKMIAAGEYDPHEIPEPIDKIVGKTLAFKIKVQPTYNRSSVVRVSPDKNLIDMILQKFPAEKIVTRLANHVIEAKIMTGKNIGNVFYIPRMTMSPSQSPWPFKFIRKQFPLIVSYAMTINKSQGQSLASVGLYLPRPVFSHGQLYVAFSRVQSKQGLKILIHDKEGKPSNTTINVVFKEVFQNL